MPSRPPDPQRSTAVAVAYDPDDQAPRVVAKGYGTLAETIIQTAQENGLYVHESPELVSLLMQVDLDSHIPPKLYIAIAELLAWLYALDGSDQSLIKKDFQPRQLGPTEAAR
ncbi:EscU/YscU/HrcU family type III secretion system export apparatus switch protein [Castellaniella sp.]|uniref:EscU/YscU/HrcU family type III secretion system export apparatus switch protein n=1 Tax=Castellaniella sp. TaxID=1955812 RepID=UPI002AFF6253|nr:EscU/YscU/HrcU family type III secretion system export apparatus switch protein [Castellaniella sp.]